MDTKALLAVFGTVFLAELGDKTQLATVLFAADAKHNPWLIFVASSLALVCAAGLAVLAGGFIAQHVNTKWLSIAAGVGFIAIGAWTLVAATRA
jgi:putative Ca2+/H+ antiporter (TMEM165/GDT1 family)